ncbi:hypothetical protein SEA_AMETHYST_66 [Streptomyces phage Amethyst]|uniref:Uncharacterized protein n=1 Tax=Streptomyces phage Amethyst TaxID=2041205 RepID=A0A291LH39_9CAUD|nr:hypothetical protein KGG83_gp66 [Streptomyces phage Amethyst]ATI18700.1 hypothetical protein SEA_AMETHYST_66 [Streptomyces phage Amethyst]
MKIPRQLSARVDESLARDIRTLRLAGLSWSQMVKWGVTLLADVYRQAYIYRQAPPCTTPILKSYIYAPYDPNHQGPPWITEEETTHEDDRPLRADVPRPRPARVADLELPGLGLRQQDDDAPGESEVRPRVPSADAAVR